MKKFCRPTFVFLICFLFFSCNDSDDLIQDYEPFGENNIIAHRGAWKNLNLPENSIASLKQAIKLRCSGSEFDIRLTADDTLVVNHDADFNSLQIENSTYTNLLNFSLSNGEKIPTLREYLMVGFKDTLNIKMVCDIKVDYINKDRLKLLASKVVQQIKKLKMERSVMIVSFDYEVLKQVKAINKNINCFYLKDGISFSVLRQDRIDVNLNYSYLLNHSKFVEEANQIGVSVSSWTVNDKTAMDYCLSQNLKYITTDEPELLYNMINKKE